MPALTVGIVFGGVSPEHEVSVITSLQAAAALDRAAYTPVPLYVSKAGRVYTGAGPAGHRALPRPRRARRPGRPRSRSSAGPDRPGARLVGLAPGGLFRKPFEEDVDVLFIGLHGGPGENGAMQGLCETIGAPYTGSGVFGSALGMDKVLTKVVCRDQGIPVVPWVSFRETDWAGAEAEWLDRIEAELGLPVVVKPARLGSSIGISKADTRDALDAAIEEALRYDEKVLVEKAVTALREVNCSVLGSPREAQASVLEEPVRSSGEALLTFAEKYQRGGGAKGAKGGGAAQDGVVRLQRRRARQAWRRWTASSRLRSPRPTRPRPAPWPSRSSASSSARASPASTSCSTTPTGSSTSTRSTPSRARSASTSGSPRACPFPALLDRMIRLALERHAAEAGRIRSYETNLLSTASIGGLKGAKR